MCPFIPVDFEVLTFNVILVWYLKSQNLGESLRRLVLLIVGILQL